MVEGGSTITQQYVKKPCSTRRQTLDRKVEEARPRRPASSSATRRSGSSSCTSTPSTSGTAPTACRPPPQEYFGVGASDLDLAQAATPGRRSSGRPGAYDPCDHPEPAAAPPATSCSTAWSSSARSTQPEADVARAGPLQLVLAGGAATATPAPTFVEQVKRFVLDDPRFGATRGERQAAALHRRAADQHHARPRPRRRRPSRRWPRCCPTRPPGPTPRSWRVEPAHRRRAGARRRAGLLQRRRPGPSSTWPPAVPGRPAGSAFKPFVLAAALARACPLDQRLPGARPPRDPRPARRGVGGRELRGRRGRRGRPGRGHGPVVQHRLRPADPGRRPGRRRGDGRPARRGRRRCSRTTSAVLGTNVVHPLDMADRLRHARQPGRAGARRASSPRSSRADGRSSTSTSPRSERVIDAGRGRPRSPSVLAGGGRATAPASGPASAGRRRARPAPARSGGTPGSSGYTPELVTAVWMGFPERGHAAR